MLTLPHLLKNTIQSFGRRTAIIEPDGELSWSAYGAAVARTAGVLRELGLAPGDRYATLCRNSVRHAQLLLAGYWSGAVPVPLNFRLAAVELAAILEDAGCRVVMVDDDFLPFFDQPVLAPWRDHVVRVRTQDGTISPAPALDDLIAQAQALRAHASAEHDEALLLYTGGTTGRGKGVRLSHRNIVGNALQMARVMAPSAEDVYLHVSPMFHSTDLKATVVSMFGGGHVYLEEFSTRGVLQAIERHGVTIASLVPTMIINLLKEEDVSQYRLDRLRLISYGTAPMDEQWLRRAMQQFGQTGFHQCYGLTESSPYLAILDEASHRQALDGQPGLLKSAGRLLPATRARFIDEEGVDVPPGEVGEIIVSGPQVAAGYLNRPDEDAATFHDGWLHTGDLGCLDDDGYLHVLDRKKDMVITGGENVYTREVESVLLLHPGIAEVAVLGIPDTRYGEALLAAVVPTGADAPDPQDVITFCRAHLGGYKIPRHFLFVPALPRSPLGKVRKHELRAAYQTSQST